MSRSSPGFVGKFEGLNVADSEYAVPPSQAIQAEDVIIDMGRVQVRPGRVELSEDQLDPRATLGMFNYTPPNGALRSLIIVRPDGIFQRVG